DVDIWYNGMADSQAARCVSLKESFGTDGVAFIKTEVPHMNSSGWHRYLLYIKDKAFISVDNIIANKNGIFDIICSWERSGNNIGQKRFSGYLEEGEQIIFPHLFDNNGLSNSIRYINEGAWFVSGTNSAFIGIENYASDILSCDADFAYFDSNIIFLAEAKKLVLDGKVIFSANEPVTCLWKLHNNLFEIHAYQPCSLSLATVSDAIPSGITQGEHNYTDVIPQSDLVNRILPSVLGELEIVSEGTKDNSSSVDPNINWKSVWVLNLNEEESEGITHIVSSKVARHKNIWVATNGELFSRIIKITAKGEILKSINYDSEILSMNSLDYTENANNLTLLVGFKDDKLRALSENGEELWHFKATIHPSFRIGDRYDAPWFTDPNPPYDMTGIFSILVDDLCGKGSEKIIIGRPCTIEFHALNGDLINSVPTRWGNNTSLAILRNRGTSNENTLLLAGKYFTGYPGITGINQDYKNISDNLFSSLVKGHFNMNAWMQRGLGHMIVEDVDNNGIDEVIFTLSGHWNELRLYSGETGEPLWALHFGPDTWGGNFMRALKVIDINKDGFKEIIVGLKSGTICSFDYKGNLIWQFRHHNGSSINCMDTMNNAKGILAVGFEDGCISMLDSNGHVVLNGRLGSSIQSIICTDAFVYAGTENGILGKYHIPGTSPRPPILRLLYH
ncbi:MAG: FG-GAP repeat domain-containing protein, partial [bacterium]